MGNLLGSMLYTDGRLGIVMMVLVLRVGVIFQHIPMTMALYRFRVNLLWGGGVFKSIVMFSIFLLELLSFIHTLSL